MNEQTLSIMACDANLMEGDLPHMVSTVVRIHGTETIIHDGTPVCRMFLHRGVVG